MKTTFSPGSVILLILILMCVAANAIHSNPLLFLSGLFFAPLIWNFLAPFLILRRLKIGKRFPECAFAKEEIPCEVEVISRSRSRFSCVSVLPFGQIPAFFRLEKVHEFQPKAGESRRVMNYSLEFFARGSFSLRETYVSCSYPFGFFTWSKSFSAETSPILIFPERVETDTFWSQLERPLNSERSWQMDGDFSGLRVWMPSDSPRQIHWRASARHRQFLAAKVDSPQPISVFLIADFSDTDSRNAEKNIALTASLVQDVCQDFAPAALGAPVTLWLKIIGQDQIEVLKSEECEDFCLAALTKLALVKCRDTSLPEVDSSREIEEFCERFPMPNVFWIGREAGKTPAKKTDGEFP